MCNFLRKDCEILGRNYKKMCGATLPVTKSGQILEKQLDVDLNLS